MHSVAWDEAQKISGKDPDFHRRDLWEAIEQRQLPGVGARRADRRGGGRARLRLRPARSRPRSSRRSSCRCSAIGRLTLEPQPGQLLRRDRAGRVPPRPRRARASTSPTTRCCRAGSSPTPTRSSSAWAGPNFHEIPINRPDRAGAQPPARRLHAADDQPRARSPTSRTRSAAAARCRRARRRAASSASPSAIDGAEGPRAVREVLRPLQPGDAVLQQPVGRRRRTTSSRRCASSSARSSGSPIRERMVGDARPASTRRSRRASPRGSGLPGIPKIELPLNHSIPADGDPKDFQPRRGRVDRAVRPLSMANTVKDTIATRKVAILAADGVDGARCEDEGGADGGRRDGQRSSRPTSE